MNKITNRTFEKFIDKENGWYYEIISHNETFSNGQTEKVQEIWLGNDNYATKIHICGFNKQPDEFIETLLDQWFPSNKKLYNETIEAIETYFNQHQ